MTLLASITVSGDMRFSKLKVLTYLKPKTAVEATGEAEVKFFYKSIVKLNQ